MNPPRVCTSVLALQRMTSQPVPPMQVPFTPCPGPRLMVRGGLDEATRRAVMRALGQGLIQVAQSTGMSSVHVTFCTAEEWGVLAELGYIQRMGIQFHWYVCSVVD